MGYRFHKKGINHVMEQWLKTSDIYAPVRLAGAGAFSDTDAIRYGRVSSVEEIEFHKKSEFSFKEMLLPLSQTLFYFTEEQVKEAAEPEREAIIFLRSCDLHAVKRLDEIYLNNGAPDYYYSRVRKKVKFILIGCERSFDNCFCVDMKTNHTTAYDASLEPDGELYRMDNRCNLWNELLEDNCMAQEEVIPSRVTENRVSVSIPENLDFTVAKASMWQEYDSRCINCGRCNFVCPTCTCFTMQDIFYKDNQKSGERRRVAASCMVDGFTEVAGGGAYRKGNGQRMRFKVLHKIYDYQKRFGYHMCVGCGRCDDICPEYISFSNCINKLEGAMEEVKSHDTE